MVANVLVTGATGYIGGSLLVHLLASGTTQNAVKVFTSVRKESQKADVEKFFPGVKVLLIDFEDAESIKKAVITNSISIAIETVDAFRFAPAETFVKALAEVNKATRPELGVHFFHTSGAKLYSSHSGFGGLGTLSDLAVHTWPTPNGGHPVLQSVYPVNNQILTAGDSLDVNTYVVVPPMVYGDGEGPGNKISIQIVALVRIARQLGKLYEVDSTDTTWALCELRDLTSLYLTILQNILNKQTPGHGGGHGIYFAENGNFSWRTLSRGILKSLGKDENLSQAASDDVAEMGKVLKCDPSWVSVSIAGQCDIKGDNGRKIGWSPKYDLDHLMSVVGEQTKTILRLDV